LLGLKRCVRVSTALQARPTSRYKSRQHLIHEAIEGLGWVSAAAIAVLIPTQHQGSPRLQGLCSIGLYLHNVARICSITLLDFQLTQWGICASCAGLPVHTEVLLRLPVFKVMQFKVRLDAAEALCSNSNVPQPSKDHLYRFWWCHCEPLSMSQPHGAMSHHVPRY